jgi:hypothetical protein
VNIPTPPAAAAAAAAASATAVTTRRPEDMTMEEFIEHVNAPMHAFLEDTANEDIKSPTAWEQHKNS